MLNKYTDIPIDEILRLAEDRNSPSPKEMKERTREVWLHARVY